MSLYKYREKRRFPRVSVKFDLIYKVNKPPEVRMRVGDEQKRAALLNLSETGMAILTDYPISELTELEMLFRLIVKEKETPTIYVVGKVCYNTEMAGEKGYRLGIEFIDIDINDRKTIANFIKLKSDSTH